MHISLDNIELQSQKESFIHQLDGRIKLILILAIILYAVYSTEIATLILMEIYLIILIIASKISLSYVFKRVMVILPFGGVVALIQPFIKEGLVLYTLPLGITITYEGTIFGLLLLSRLLVCLTAIVFLSSVTPVQEMVSSSRKLGFPKEMAMILSLTIRYIFMFYDELGKIRKAQKTRCFDIWSRKTSYMWKMKQIGYTVMMLFLRSYEQGEKVYLSMASRCYTGDSDIYSQNRSLSINDYSLIFITIFIITILECVKLFLF